MSAKPHCLVVGIGPGLGRSLVRRFAREGHHVSFMARRPEAIVEFERELRREGADVSGHVADAGDPASFTRAFETLRKAHGTPQVLIYNAALIEPARFITPSGLGEARYGQAAGWSARGAPADFDYLMQSFRTNVAGAHHAAAAVAPAMMAAGRGTILITGGVLAFGPWLEWGVTSLGKAALRSLALSLEKELAPANVHVSIVHIHGTMAPGTPCDPDLVAGFYADVWRQPRETWTAEEHFKPAGSHERDPDA